jgi:tRNA threonylcarbamoyladenosine biosynthesis protein TsaB
LPRSEAEGGATILMIVLGIDTATAVSAVGVVRDGVLVADVVERSGRGHAARLPALVERTLEMGKLTLEQVDAVAVSTGPGSFTGLRVGLGFAKGMAFAGIRRVVGVSTLEALAAAAPGDFSRIATVTDARRGETYVALFRRSDREVVRICEDLALTPEAAAARVGEALRHGGRVLLVGDAAERYPQAFGALREQGLDVASLDEVHPRGGIVAMLGARRLAAGHVDRAEGLVPVYVRAAAAENVGRTSLTMENGVS